MGIIGPGLRRRALGMPSQSRKDCGAPRAANTGDYYVLRNLGIPAVLVECGFLSNPAEEALLLSPEYRQQVAEALCAGITAYLAVK